MKKYMLGMREKKNEKQKITKSRKKFPVWLPIPSSTKSGGRLFSGVGKHRKQAGPTLGGTGVQV